MTWQPISTAPKDGTRVLAFIAPDEITIVQHCADGCWRDDSGWTDAAFSLEFMGIPTHWMPLPSPPVPLG